MLPIHCDSCGTRRPRNHEFTSRMSEVNTVASPAPTRMRPMIASAIVGAKATVTCPTTMSAVPTIIRAREPTRSMRIPTGICMAA